VTRAPINQLSPPQLPIPQPRRIAFQPPVLESASVPAYGQLELPSRPEAEVGPADGMTLDDAIDRLLQKNLNLLSLRFEVPMAQADVLTASLRNNPIFYADSQLVPYGHYSNQRPGGQLQYDINVTLQLDVWRKRRARTLVAERAKRATEAQLQDAVRLQIDNLWTAYVDVVAAVKTLEFSETYVRGITALHKLVSDLFQRGQRTEAEVLAVAAQLRQAEIQVREARQSIQKTKNTLALLLDLPPAEAESFQVRSIFYDVRPLPVSTEELNETARDSRPDLASFRLGLQRAQADVLLARRSRYSDVYLLYQPYTLQNNTPLGLKSAYSYAFGVTVALPVYNRNQGNIHRSELNAVQSKYELAGQERQVRYDVVEAVREFDLSRLAVLELQRDVLPASRRVRDAAWRRFQGGFTSAMEYLDAQKDYNEVVRNYRDAVVRHRRAMLDLNTAVGVRVLP
jgi:cobalt-zinc-cadmium efflux system outer membrane protein